MAMNDVTHVAGEIEGIGRRLDSASRLMLDTLDRLGPQDDAQHAAHNDLYYLAESLADIEARCNRLCERLRAPAVDEDSAT